MLVQEIVAVIVVLAILIIGLAFAVLVAVCAALSAAEVCWRIGQAIAGQDRKATGRIATKIANTVALMFRITPDTCPEIEGQNEDDYCASNSSGLPDYSPRWGASTARSMRDAAIERSYRWCNHCVGTGKSSSPLGNCSSCGGTGYIFHQSD